MPRLDLLLADLITLASGGWAMARALLRDRFGPLAMANAWSGWLEVAGLAAAAHGRFYRGQRRLALGLLALAGWQASRAVALRLPARLGPTPLLGAATAGGAQPRGTDLRLLTLNLLYTHSRCDGFVALIQREQPDVVCLQELTPPVAERLCALLGDDYPHRLLAPSAGSNGYGILSRLPLVAGDFLQTPGGVSRYAQRATVLVGGREIDVYNCHLMPPLGKTFRYLGPTIATRLREAQITAMVEAIRTVGRPAVVAGDFNLTPYQEGYRLLAPTLTDSWLEAGVGTGVTWPLSILPQFTRFVPLLRIDYCWHTAELQATRSRVAYTLTGSDHCPVVVDLAWAVGQAAIAPDGGRSQARPATTI